MPYVMWLSEQRTFMITLCEYTTQIHARSSWWAKWACDL